MEIDAVILFAKVFQNNDASEAELLIVRSYIVNKNIDINMSIHENLSAIDLDDADELLCEKVKEIALNKEEFLDIPIFNLILKSSKFCYMLIEANEKRCLSEESILYIVENCLAFIDNELNAEVQSIIDFLMSFLSRRKFTLKKEIIQNSKVINEFVKKNEYTVVDDKNRNANDYARNFFVKMLIFKLFACGYVTFDYNQVLDSESQESGIEKIVYPLVIDRCFGHLRLMVNSVSIGENGMAEFKDCIARAYKFLYDGEVNQEEAAKDKGFIDALNIFFKLVNVDKLNYEELISKGIGIIL